MSITTIKTTYTHEEYSTLHFNCSVLSMNLRQAEETNLELKNIISRLQSEIDILYENKRLVTELEALKLEKLSAAQAESDKIQKAKLVRNTKNETDIDGIGFLPRFQKGDNNEPYINGIGFLPRFRKGE